MANEFEQTNATTREFTLQFLQQITDNFSEEHIIGRGGYGVVYKGKLEDGEEIAIKELYPMPGLDDRQFRNEFNHLTRTKHPNITRLVGYCYNQHERKQEGECVFAIVEKRFLCFEYLRRGSLDKYISDESQGLDWHTRFKIIKGVCDGLNYLHNGSQYPIYHLDLKPENILLDEKMIPKIGDFGLSRLSPSTQTYITTKVIGTRGYMPLEYLTRGEITSKHDVFSLGVIIIRIMAGYDSYFKFADMSSSQEFLELVTENWDKQVQAAMSVHTSEQVKTCIGIALRCVELERKKRPTIAEIVDELNKIDSAESLHTGLVANFRSKHALNRNSNSERRGRIIFSGTYGTPVSFDVFCCFWLTSVSSELRLTDGVSYNYNCRSIPPAALKTLLKNPKAADKASATIADVDAGHVSGLVFVSERDDGLETLYIAVRFNADWNVIQVFALADIFGAADFSGVRLEDSGCFGGGYTVGCRTVDHCLIYVSTKEAVKQRRSPCTVVYKTNLTTGKTDRLTPEGVFDLSPAVSPSGKMVAVASFESKSWNGELENLKTDIYVMNVDSEGQLGRKLLIKNGGWPSWGSDNIIFFHRGTDKTFPSASSMVVETDWGVFRYNIRAQKTVRVTPKNLDAVTPAAISETKVAVATFRRNVPVQYRHIEIFSTKAEPPVQITQRKNPRCNHYNPFVLYGDDCIGYHRDVYPQNMHKLESPTKDVSLYRVSGMLPAISKDGSKLAFVDNKSKVVWLADSQGLRIVHERTGSDSVFSPVWNQDSDKDTLYICVGPSLESHRPLEIYSITNVSSSDGGQEVRQLTYGKFNNAFPSSSPDGGMLVFQSTRDFCLEKTGSARKHRNLYIMLNAAAGESDENCWVTRLTKGSWTDTQCQWSPSGDWIVFLSTRDRQPLLTSKDAFDELEEEDLGYLSVFLVKASNPVVVIKVLDNGANPVFSPDGRSIALTTDLVAVSVDPISLPKFARLCSNIFVVDIDPEDDYNKKQQQQDYVIKGLHHQMTHSRYGCGTPAWTTTRVDVNPDAPWKMMELQGRNDPTQSSISVEPLPCQTSGRGSKDLELRTPSYGDFSPWRIIPKRGSIIKAIYSDWTGGGSQPAL